MIIYSGTSKNDVFDTRLSDAASQIIQSISGPSGETYRG